MSQLSAKPIHKQITRYFFGIFFSVFIVILLIFVMFYYKNMQNSVVDEQVKEEIQQFQLQLLINKNKLILKELLAASTAKDYQNQHQLLINHWRTLIDIDKGNRQQYEQLLLLAQQENDAVQRIASNSERNIALKHESIAELEFALQALDIIQAKKNFLAQQLRQQILQDVVNDDITVSRALAQTDLLVENKSLLQLNMLFSNALLTFQNMNLHTSISDFDQAKINLEQAFTLINIERLHERTEAEYTLFLEKVKMLESLLLSQQRAMAKWKGHLRLAQDYHLFLFEQSQVFDRILLKNQTSFEQDKATNSMQTQLILGNNIELSNQRLFLGLISIIAVFSAIFLYLLVALLVRIKKFGLQTVDTVANIISGKEEGHSASLTYELQQIKSLISRLTHPTYKESDYELMMAQHKHQLDTLCLLNNIAYWQIASAEKLLICNEYVAQVLSLDNKQIKQHWRHWFNKKDVHSILIAAKKAKIEEGIQVVHVVGSDNNPYSISFNYLNRQWSGTIKNEESLKVLENEILNLNSEADNFSKQQLNIEKVKNDQLSLMVIQAMIESQLISLEFGTMSTTIYSPLVNMIDWLRQHQICTHMQESAKALNLVDVDFNEEVYAAILNAMNEAKACENTILLECDQLLMTYAKLNSRLFHRFIIALCRFLFTDQTKANLLFNIAVSDQNSGQQLMRFTLSLKSETTLKKLPALLTSLINDEKVTWEKSPGLLGYLHALLHIMHGKNLAAKLTDSGYQLSFELPIAIAKQQKHSIDEVSLKQANILSLSTDKDLNRILKKSINTADGQFDVLGNINNFSQQLSIKKLSSKPLDVVLVSPEVFSHDFARVNQHIDALPKKLQPKTMVLQTTSHTNLHHDGFYSQTSNPLCRIAFLKELQSLLKNEKRINQDLSADVFKQFQYQQTNVEVLLAVSKPSAHQSLLRILDWLGLQVRIVAQSQSMIKHWQSGRYLVLITEFEQSPFIELLTGQIVSRGIFTLGDDILANFSQQKNDHFKHWQLAALPEKFDLMNLAKALNSWLKEKNAQLPVESAGSSLAKKKPKTTPKKSKVHQRISEHKAITKSKPKSETKSGNKVNEAFDFKRYIVNQGSAELAVYMLDEYVQSNVENLSSLSSAIEGKNLTQAQQALSVLTLNAKILSASEMLAICRSIEDALTKNSFNQAGALLEQVTGQIAAIETYAESF